jgi:hypothetical protein
VKLRAATIIGTLRTVASDAQLDQLVALADRLESEWLLAVDEAGGSTAAQKDAFNPKIWKKAFDVARAGLLGRPAPGTGDAPLPLWVGKWATVSDWAGKLQNGQADAIDLAAVDADDRERRLSLTLMLNAAWLARVRPDPAHDAPPDEVELVANRAVRRMLEYVHPSHRPVAPMTNARPSNNQ